MHAAERVAVRARQLREAAGTLSGAALANTEDATRDVLADLAAVIARQPAAERRSPAQAAAASQELPVIIASDY